LGAKPGIVIMEDVSFLSETFKGADTVYMMATLGKEIFFDGFIHIVQEIT